MNTSKSTTGGGGGGNGGGNRGKDQRPQRELDPTHTRDSIVVEINPNEDLKEAIKNNKVVLFHDSSEPGYSFYNHLTNGGVDFAHFDLAKISDPSERAMRSQDLNRAIGYKKS